MRKLTPPLATLTLAVLIAVAGLAADGYRSPAEACLWRLTDGGNPLPPCRIDDLFTSERLRQANNQIIGKLATIQVKIRQVRREVHGWQRSYETMRNFEDLLQRTWGDLTADPLPSLVVAYNRTGLGSYVAATYEGGRFDADILDLNAAADSIWGTFQNQMDVERMYESALRPRIEGLERESVREGERFKTQMLAIGDWRRQTQPARDSLFHLSNRIAQRYEGRGDADGVAETRISSLSTSLTHLRGTSFEAQARSVQARMEALESSAEAGRRVRRNLATQAGSARN